MARGPRGAQVPAAGQPPAGAQTPDRTRRPAKARPPDGTDHPALRGLPAVWLRANCPCGACRDPRSGQRLVTITSLPADVTVAEVRAQARAFYAACHAFAERVSGPEATVTAMLSPGDCVIVDNTRVLHGRAGFTDRRGGGRRHLQGCYADLDGLASTVAVIARGHPGRPGQPGHSGPAGRAGS